MSQPSPFSRIVRPRELSALLGISYSTVWRMQKRGDFPRPIQISTQAVGWRLADIEAWIAAREARSA